jgi:hypothetical protein
MDRQPSRRQVVQGVGVAGLGLLAACGRWCCGAWAVSGLTAKRVVTLRSGC